MAAGVVQFGSLGDLIQSIAMYLDVDNTDSTDPTVVAIPGFVKLAEATIGRRLRCQENLARAITTLDYPEELLPTDFGSIRSVMVGPSGGAFTPLTYLRPDIFEQVPDPNEFGLYTLYSGKIVLYPSNVEFYTSAETPYEMRLVYFNRPRLGDLSSTNAVLSYHPDIYLYASLVSAGTFVIDTLRMNAWMQLYDSAVDSANMSYEESHGTPFFAPVLGP
jgi:hypothetical protein